jgi:hypothetical protein
MTKSKKFRVYDNRNNKTLFKGTNIACLNYIADTVDTDSDDFDYIWLEEVEE